MASVRPSSNDSKKAHSVPKIPDRVYNWRENLTQETLPDLVEALAGSLGRLDDGYYTQLYTFLAAIAAVAQRMEADEGAWKRFCRHEFWSEVRGNRPKANDSADTLPYVMRFSMGVSGTKSAQRYVRAIGPLLREGTTPEDLAEAIREAGGIVELEKSHRKKKNPETDDLTESPIERPAKRKDAPDTGSDSEEGGERHHSHDGNERKAWIPGGKTSPKRRSASTAPAESVSEEHEDDDGDDDSENEEDATLEPDDELEEPTTHLRINLALPKSVRSDWLKTVDPPRSLLLTMDIVDVERNRVSASLVEWEDNNPLPRK